MGEMTDPLQLLPSEIVLRILEFTDCASLASLTRLNRTWHSFIDETHQESIYSGQTDHELSKGFSFLEDAKSFSKYFQGVQSWKELIKRETLLARNWNSEQPVTRESTIQVGNDPVWRFKPDFKRRIILSTSQAGGLNVTDMETGNRLWRLGSDTVRPFAHLEYQDGTAVWDCEGNAVEVWRTDQEGLPRGEFRKVAILPHERMTRGFQLSYNTLCVVSSEGQGFVYEDIVKGNPRLKTQIEIDDGAVGHLDQGPDAVVYSLGAKGYHFYDKASGQCLGVLKPQLCREKFHIEHDESSSRSDFRLGEGSLAGLATAFPPQHPRKDRTMSLAVRAGSMPTTDGEFLALEDDEWGAGMLSGSLFVGISRGGRVVVCSDWRSTLEHDDKFNLAHTSLVECDSDGSNFDLGGWLSVKDHRVMFEVQDRIYVLGLGDSNQVVVNPTRPSFSFASCLSNQLAVPVSFMAIYDDCIMTTYTTLRNRQRSGLAQHNQPRAGILPTKVIRILSFAPALSEDTDRDYADRADQATEDEPQQTGRRYDTLLREDMYQLIEMLVGGDDEDEMGDAQAQAQIDVIEDEENDWP